MVKPSPEKKTQTSISKTQQNFKGVRMRKWGKWVSEVRVPNSKGKGKIWLGSYDTPQQAARAYDCAVYCLRGPQAKFNFPDSLPEIPSASMLSPAQIQAVAAKFGKEEFRQALDCNATFSGSESQSCMYSPQSLEERDLGMLDSLLKEVERFDCPITEDLGPLDSLFEEFESFESPITEDFLPLDKLFEDTDFLKVFFSSGWKEDLSNFSISNN